MKKIHFEHINSTSSYLKENYDKYDNLTFVSADYQDKGHGRNNRVWFSEKGKNLLFSVLIKDGDLFSKASDLSLASSVCVYKVLKTIGLENVSIKWPNDVYVNDKKIAGILLESVSYGKGIEALVVGIGINVNDNSFNKDLVDTATSISLEIGNNVDLMSFNEEIYDEFIKTLEEIKLGSKDYLLVVKNNNYLLGKKVYALVNGVKEEVEVVDVNDDNSLKVKLRNEYMNLYSGEVTFHV